MGDSTDSPLEEMMDRLTRSIDDLDATSQEHIERASNEPRHIKDRKRDNLIEAVRSAHLVCRQSGRG